jgi:hypothetical protein
MDVSGKQEAHKLLQERGQTLKKANFHFGFEGENKQLN